METKELPNRILIDGDIFAFRCSSAVQKDIDWGNGLWTCHAYLDEAVDYLNVYTKTVFDALCDKIQIDLKNSERIYCFSDPQGNNFRKALNPKYKYNRKTSRKPTCYAALVDYIKDNYGKYVFSPSLEGDDCIAILSTENQHKNTSLIISADKDFNTIPNVYFYNINKDELKYITIQDAYRNLLIQTLSGDTADNYKGCPSIGKIKATRLINQEENPYRLWELVENTFVANGATKEDAMLNFTMAYLLHYSDVDINKEGHYCRVKEANPTYEHFKCDCSVAGFLP